MYAIVQFLRGSNKEYTVVPIIWLFDNNTMCYWPRVKTEDELAKLVKANSPYDKRWPKYKVHKVVKSSDDYDGLQLNLTEFLEQSTTDSSSSALQLAVINNRSSRESDISESDDSPKSTTRKHKSKNKSQKRKRKSKKNEYEKPRSSKCQSPKRKKQRSTSTCDTSDTDDKENESDHNAESQEINNKSLTHNSRESSPNFPLLNLPPPSPSILTRSITGLESLKYCSTNSSSPKSSAPLRNITHTEHLDFSPRSSQYINSQPTSDQSINERPMISGQSPSTPRVSQSRRCKVRNLSQEEFQIEVLTKLGTLGDEISQMNTLIGQLARSAQLGNLKTVVQPDGFPTLPIETITDFRSFDSLLKVEVYETYFTNRLAAIGGINVRQSVMHILKFTMTNRVAMEFNWAGRDKKQPFQGTEIVKIISAAVKLRFADSPEATDLHIHSAVKDWLKQAKHRLACQEKSVGRTT